MSRPRLHILVIRDDAARPLRLTLPRWTGKLVAATVLLSLSAIGVVLWDYKGLLALRREAPALQVRLADQQRRLGTLERRITEIGAQVSEASTWSESHARVWQSASLDPDVVGGHAGPANCVQRLLLFQAGLKTEKEELQALDQVIARAGKLVASEKAGQDGEAQGRMAMGTTAGLTPRPGLRAKRWTHPVMATLQRLPERENSRFGASRPSVRPAECMAGHCGVDLYAPRGTPVVAISAGVVTRVVRVDQPHGGRYVKIEHLGGTSSYYMHLDTVREDIVSGTIVAEGECIGTLGRSGIVSSPAHLHFQVSVTSGESEKFIDPEPMLAGATVLAAANVATAMHPGGPLVESPQEAKSSSAHPAASNR